MFRRCLSLLLIVAFFASQMAGVPHAHAGTSAAEKQRHDASPHIHVGTHRHGEHDHSHDGHRQKSAVGEQSASEAEGDSIGDGLTCSDHDSDAIYLPQQADSPAIGTARSPAETSVVLATLTTVSLAMAKEVGDQRIAIWHPPDEVLDASETYLTLRNLRL